MRENSAKSGITEGQFEHNGAIASASMYLISARPAPSLRYCSGQQEASELARKTGQGSHFYILTCRIGPLFLDLRKNSLLLVALCWWILMVMNGCEQNGAFQFVSTGIFKQLMVKHADLLVCDSKNIEKYIKGL